MKIVLGPYQKLPRRAQTDRRNGRSASNFFSIRVPSDALGAVLVEIQQANIEGRSSDVAMLLLIPVLTGLANGLDRFWKGGIDVGGRRVGCGGGILVRIVAALRLGRPPALDKYGPSD